VRKLLTILVLIAGLLSQGYVAAKGLVDIDAAVHATSHAAAAHHHDDDGSTHYDSSDESLQHMQADHMGVVSGPTVAPAPLAAPVLRYTATAAAQEEPPPDPYLEGPRRPPRREA
jgi:hypothetical protein